MGDLKYAFSADEWQQNQDQILELKAEIEGLKTDTARYRFLCDNQVARHSIRMDGTSGFRFHGLYGRARSFNELLDAKIHANKALREDQKERENAT